MYKKNEARDLKHPLDKPFKQMSSDELTALALACATMSKRLIALANNLEAITVEELQRLMTVIKNQLVIKPHHARFAEISVMKQAQGLIQTLEMMIVNKQRQLLDTTLQQPVLETSDWDIIGPLLADKLLIKHLGFDQWYTLSNELSNLKNTNDATAQLLSRRIHNNFVSTKYCLIDDSANIIAIAAGLIVAGCLLALAIQSGYPSLAVNYLHQNPNIILNDFTFEMSRWYSFVWQNLFESAYRSNLFNNLIDIYSLTNIILFYSCSFDPSGACALSLIIINAVVWGVIGLGFLVIGAVPILATAAAGFLAAFSAAMLVYGSATLAFELSKIILEKLLVNPEAQRDLIEKLTSREQNLSPDEVDNLCQQNPSYIGHLTVAELKLLRQRYALEAVITRHTPNHALNTILTNIATQHKDLVSRDILRGDHSKMNWILQEVIENHNRTLELSLVSTANQTCTLLTNPTASRLQRLFNKIESLRAKPSHNIAFSKKEEKTLDRLHHELLMVSSGYYDSINSAKDYNAEAKATHDAAVTIQSHFRRYQTQKKLIDTYPKTFFSTSLRKKTNTTRTNSVAEAVRLKEIHSKEQAQAAKQTSTETSDNEISGGAHAGLFYHHKSHFRFDTEGTDLINNEAPII